MTIPSQSVLLVGSIGEWQCIYNVLYLQPDALCGIFVVMLLRFH